MRARPPLAAQQLVEVALRRAAQELRATGGPLLPTSMHRDAEGDRLVRYRADDLDAAIRRARHELAAVPLDTWVLVWDGWLTADGVRTEALYGHLEVVGEQHAHLYAQRYQRLADRLDVPEPPIYLGRDGRFDGPDRAHPLTGGGPPQEAGRRGWWSLLRRRRHGRGGGHGTGSGPGRA